MPLHEFENLDKELALAISKRVAKQFQYVSKLEKHAQDISDMVVSGLVASVNFKDTGQGIKRTLPPTGLMTISLIKSYFIAYRDISGFIEEKVGMGEGNLPALNSVLIRSHSEFISDMLTVVNKAPEVVFHGITTEDLIVLSQLSMGPKALFLGKGKWTRDPLLRPFVVNKGPVVRVSKHQTVQGIRKFILLKTMSWSFRKRKDNSR